MVASSAVPCLTVLTSSQLSPPPSLILSAPPCDLNEALLNNCQRVPRVSSARSHQIALDIPRAYKFLHPREAIDTRN